MQSSKALNQLSAMGPMLLAWTLGCGSDAEQIGPAHQVAAATAALHAKRNRDRTPHHALRRAPHANCDAAGSAPDAGAPGSPGPLPGETCYTFQVHDGQTLSDKTPYAVPVGEHYAQFYYAAPWPTGAVATRIAATYDTEEIVHHWFLYSTSELETPGSHLVSVLPTLIGTNPRMLAAGAVGSSNLVMPEDVGLELPPNGSMLDIQWHYANGTFAPATDLSSIQVCTVPANQRRNVASLTLIGTEDLGGNRWFGGAGMPPQQRSEFQGTCNPTRAGIHSSDPINIVGFWPYMQALGTDMRVVIHRPNAADETVFNEPVDFEHLVYYPRADQLRSGETLTVACKYNNTRNVGVPFGDTVDDEMCYNFVVSYPARALDNGVPSLFGPLNTCW